MADEQRLSELLIEFAHTLTTDFSIQRILDHLTLRILDVLPVTGAGVMLMGSDEDMHFVSASDDVLLQVESLQIELDEGPCLEAHRTGQPILIPDLAHDRRFPRFGPRAVESGLRAVYSFPMRMDGGRLGAADLYRDYPGDLAEEDAAIGQVLADVAAAYIMNARGRVASEHAEQRLRHQALHDPLTRLPNRTLLYDRIAHALAKASRGGGLTAVVFIDLDRFKNINDTFGHHAGDQLLTAVAERLLHILRRGDTLARISGDEFIVLCEGLDQMGQAATVVQRIMAEFAAPFQLGDKEVVVTASIGVAFATEDDTPERLLQDADAAMYRAKAQGGARFHIGEEGVRRSRVLRRSPDEHA